MSKDRVGGLSHTLMCNRRPASGIIVHRAVFPWVHFASGAIFVSAASMREVFVHLTHPCRLALPRMLKVSDQLPLGVVDQEGAAI